ncbi:cupin domain-containing protein [Planosporangium thailandense]|uniref:Cupin domain-containing protein n=1 Tax=Planosporangium thailandense TaxID=765197 RepID=A0ABX0XT55_9ACTN|nr:cupin domain-containing protein [Planosporangium thailandense]NJC68996.1 cupin domain-containing protein [Planosporangium thailandense]
MPLTRDADARAHQMHGFTFRSLATPSLGSPELAVWAVDAPAGSSSPRHTMSRDEVFIVHTGRLVATIDDEKLELAPGDALTVPAGAEFAVANPFAEPARAVACTTAGMHATVGGQTIAPPWAA